MGLFSWIRRLFGRPDTGVVSAPTAQQQALQQLQTIIQSLGGAEWYYERGGQRVGPFSLLQLQQLVAAGQLSPADQVCRQGQAWVPLSAVLPGVQIPSSPSPAAPPPFDVIYSPLQLVSLEPGESPYKPDWFYSTDRKQYERVSLVQLRVLVQTGQIGTQAIAWRSGLAGWVPVLRINFPTGSETAAPAAKPQMGGSFVVSPSPSVAESGSPARSPAPPPPSSPTTPVVVPQPPRAPAAPPRGGAIDLDAADFLPIARSDLKEQAKDVTRGGAWFGRRDLIPPAEDPRTKLIDCALVTHGLLSPEQLVEIHTVGAEMDRVKPQQAHIEAEVFRSGEAAVQAERERRARLKAEKKAAAAQRKKDHADAVARRKATDILFLGRGVSRRLNERVSDVTRLAAAGLPLLSTPAELSAALGLTVPRLRWLAFHTEVATRIHYVQFTVPKKSGGLRTLSAPHKTLAAAQRWIFENIVTKLPAEPAAHGFLPGKSILTNAAPHVGQAVVINADLEDFFPSITFRRVRSVFQRLGYSGAVATILTLLCTECPRRTARYENKSYYVATGPRGLPQGACTSPGLSNQVARRLDRRLTGLAKRLGLTYTRYADDLTYSGPLPLPISSKSGEVPSEPAAQKRQGIGYLMARLRHIAEEEGFRIKETKSRVLPRSTAQMVTGIVVNAKPSIRRAEIRRLRAILHHARKEGLEAQNREGRKHFRTWLEGKIAYVAMVRPDVGAKLKAALAEVRT